jgi:hypothetical protein
MNKKKSRARAEARRNKFQALEEEDMEVATPREDKAQEEEGAFNIIEARDPVKRFCVIS